MTHREQLFTATMVTATLIVMWGFILIHMHGREADKPAVSKRASITTEEAVQFSREVGNGGIIRGTNIPTWASEHNGNLQYTPAGYKIQMDQYRRWRWVSDTRERSLAYKRLRECVVDARLDWKMRNPPPPSVWSNVYEKLETEL